jgi:hypothetical protein
MLVFEVVENCSRGPIAKSGFTMSGSIAGLTMPPSLFDHREPINSCREIFGDIGLGGQCIIY